MLCTAAAVLAVASQAGVQSQESVTADSDADLHRGPKIEIRYEAPRAGPGIVGGGVGLVRAWRGPTERARGCEPSGQAGRVGWTMANHLRSAPFLDPLKMAAAQRKTACRDPLLAREARSRAAPRMARPATSSACTTPDARIPRRDAAHPSRPRRTTPERSRRTPALGPRTAHPIEASPSSSPTARRPRRRPGAAPGARRPVERPRSDPARVGPGRRPAGGRASHEIDDPRRGAPRPGAGGRSDRGTRRHEAGIFGRVRSTDEAARRVAARRASPPVPVVPRTPRGDVTGPRATGRRHGSQPGGSRGGREAPGRAAGLLPYSPSAEAISRSSQGATRRMFVEPGWAKGDTRRHDDLVRRLGEARPRARPGRPPAPPA